MKVYAIFRARGESDSWTVFNLEGLALNEVAAKRDIAELYAAYKKDGLIDDDEEDDPFYYDPVHSSMCKENGYVYFGKRGDCKRQCSQFGGYVVEEMEASG